MAKEIPFTSPTHLCPTPASVVIIIVVFDDCVIGAARPAASYGQLDNVDDERDEEAEHNHPRFDEVHSELQLREEYLYLCYSGSAALHYRDGHKHDLALAFMRHIIF